MKTVIITGATRGIGLATAKAFAQAGARVVISSRKQEACEAVAAELGGIAIPAHIGRPEECINLIEETLRRTGRIDVLVANAAINPVFAPVSELPQPAWDKVFSTNLTAPWQLACQALPHIAQQAGSVVFVSSINAHFGVKNSGAYGISKAALEQLTRQLAIEWGNRGVRINAVAPGTTRTDMIRAMPENFLESVISRTPLARLGEPEDIAEAILFFSNSKHITGQVLTVDGGETIQR